MAAANPHYTRTAKKQQIAAIGNDPQALVDVLRVVNQLKGQGNPDSPFNLSGDILHRYFGDNASISWTLYHVLHATCEGRGLVGMGADFPVKMLFNPGRHLGATDHERRVEDNKILLAALHSEKPISDFAPSTESLYAHPDLGAIRSIFSACKPMLSLAPVNLSNTFAAAAGSEAPKSAIKMEPAVNEEGLHNLLQKTASAAAMTSSAMPMGSPAPRAPKTPGAKEVVYAYPFSGAKPVNGGIGAAVGRATVGGASGMKTPGRSNSSNNLTEDVAAFPPLGGAGAPNTASAPIAIPGSLPQHPMSGSHQQQAPAGSYRQSVIVANGSNRMRSGSFVTNSFSDRSIGGAPAPTAVDAAAVIGSFTAQQLIHMGQAKEKGMPVEKYLEQLSAEAAEQQAQAAAPQSQQSQSLLGKVSSFFFSPGGTTVMQKVADAPSSSSSSSAGLTRIPSGLPAKSAATYEAEADEMRHVLQMKGNECLELKQEIAGHLNNLATLTDEHNKVKEELALMQADRDTLQWKLTSSENELKEYKAQSENMLRIKTAAVQDAELAAEQANADKDACKKLYEELKATSEAAARESEDKIRRLQENVSDYQSKLKASNDKMAEMQGSIAAKDTEIEGLKSQCKQSLTQLKELQQAHGALKQQLSDLQQEYQQQKEKDDAVIAEYKSQADATMALHKKLEDKQAEIAKMKANFKQMSAEVKEGFADAQEKCVFLKQQCTASLLKMAEAVKSADMKAALANKRYLGEQAERRRLHNKMQEERGNIRVVARIRPLLPKELAKEGVTQEQWDTMVDLNSSFGSVSSTAGGAGTGPLEVVKALSQYELTVLEAPSDRAGGRMQESKTYEFDYVFGPKSTQEEVFDEVAGLTTSSMDGYHCCIFAYGQTGSGKTHTMMGSGKENPGVYSRAFKALFEQAETKATEWRYEIRVQFIEIYNETINDLLTEKSSSTGAGAGKGAAAADDDSDSGLKIKQGPNGNYVEAKSVPVNCVADVETVMEVGQKNRSVGRTNANEHSSRSHSLLMIEIAGHSLIRDDLKTFGKLVLVDLAGSERLNKSGAEGQRKEEAKNINSSLLALGDVVQALVEKRSHIPFRNSKLTHLLQDSLGKENKTLMIVQVSPALDSRQETVCSLNFAQRAKKVEQGKAAKHGSGGMDATEASRLKNEIKKLTEGKAATEEAALSFKKELAHANDVLEAEKRSKASLEKELAVKLHEVEVQAQADRAAAKAMADELEKARKEAKAAEAQAKKAIAAAGAQSTSNARSESEAEARINAAVKKAVEEANAAAKKALYEKEQALAAEAEKKLNNLKKQHKEEMQQKEKALQEKAARELAAALDKADKEAKKLAAAAAANNNGAAGNNRRTSFATHGGAGAPRDRLSFLPGAIASSLASSSSSTASSANVSATSVPPLPSGSPSLNSSAIALEEETAAAVAGTPVHAPAVNPVSVIKETDEIEEDEEDESPMRPMPITPGLTASGKKAQKKLLPLADDGESLLGFVSPTAVYPAASASAAVAFPATPAVAAAAEEDAEADNDNNDNSRRSSELGARKPTPFVSKKSLSHLMDEKEEDEAGDSVASSSILDSSVATEASAIEPEEEKEGSSVITADNEEPEQEHTGFKAFGQEDKEYLRGRDEKELQANAANVGKAASRLVRHHRGMPTPGDEKPKGLLKSSSSSSAAAAGGAGAGAGAGEKPAAKKGVMIQTPGKGTIRQPGQLNPGSNLKASTKTAKAGTSSAASSDTEGDSRPSSAGSRRVGGAAVTFAGSTPGKAGPLVKAAAKKTVVGFAAGATPAAKLAVNAALEKRKATPKPTARPADDDDEEEKENEETAESTNTSSITAGDADLADASFRSSIDDAAEGAVDPLSIAQSLAGAFADTAPPKGDAAAAVAPTSAAAPAASSVIKATVKPAGTLKVSIRKPAVPTMGAATPAPSAGAGASSSGPSTIKAKISVKVATVSRASSSASLPVSASEGNSLASSLASSRASSNGRGALNTSVSSTVSASGVPSFAAPTMASSAGLVARKAGGNNIILPMPAGAARIVGSSKPTLKAAVPTQQHREKEHKELPPVTGIIIEGGGSAGSSENTLAAPSAAPAPAVAVAAVKKLAGGAQRVAVPVARK